MNVQHVLSGNRIASHRPQVLKPGQIIQGKIMKLFPDQKAQIQLGSQTIIAQLEASLSAGTKYHFQVQPSDDVVHLRVLGDQLKNQAAGNVMELLQQLGLKATRSNAALVQSLIGEKIPFTREQLQRAFQLLNHAKNSQQSQRIIKGMISKGLPLTNSVYQALASVSSGGITGNMASLLHQLRQNPDQTSLQQNLAQQIGQMIEPASVRQSFVNQVAAEALGDKQQLFQTLKAAGAVDPALDFSTWKAEWTTYARQGNGINGKMPFQLDHAKIVQTLESLMKHQTNIKNASRTLVQQWSSTIERAVMNDRPLTNQGFLQLKQQLAKSFLPWLTTAQQQIAKHIDNSPHQMQQLLTTLQILAIDQTYTTLENVLTSLKAEGRLLLASPKEQFLNHVQQMLRYTGLNYENQLAGNNMHMQQDTIKSMLIQFIQQSDGAVNERSQQLLNFLNGMQIQSVNETVNAIQANLQMPGQKLGLPDDLHLAFSGHKTEDGKVSADSCRILFYLNLSHLEETVIDMHVQKRAVSVTIYNDQQNLAERSAALKPVLSEGLASLDYHLSTITFKPLHENNGTGHETVQTTYQKPYQGVDYRI